MSSESNSKLDHKSLNRRELLRNIAVAVTVIGTGALELEAAQHIHRIAEEEKKRTGAYQPKYFKPQEYKTLKRLTELIIPADKYSGSALEAGAPEFIDLLCSQNPELARIFVSGMFWLDWQMQKSEGARFIEVPRAQQTKMLDLLAVEADPKPSDYHVFASRYAGFHNYTNRPPLELSPGASFFDWIRRLTVDAFYTSAIGIKDVAYKGNRGMLEYKVPKEVLSYVEKLEV